MAFRLALVLPALAFTLWQAGSEGDAERQCTAERTAFYEQRYAPTRSDGPTARARLLEEVRLLLRTYRGRAPECVGRLREHEAYLEVLDGRYEAVVETLEAYLAGEGLEALARTQVSLRSQMGYALTEMGETVDGAQAYYEAASLADRAPARYGARALVSASMTARVLGDFEGARTYLDSALALIEDSLATNPDLTEIKGHALVTRSFLLRALIDRAGSQAERDSLIAGLEATTGEAVRTLSDEGQEGGRKALAITLNALALSLTGRHGEALERLRPAFGLARSAQALVPKALYATYEVEGQIKRAAGDADGARASYAAAMAEADRVESTTDRAEILERLGRLAEEQGDLEGSADLYEEAIALEESHRARLGLDDWSATAFDTMLRPYEGLVRVRLAQGRAADALVTLDLTRARYLRDLRESNRVRRTLPPSRRPLADSLIALRQESREAERAAATVAERIGHLRRSSELLQDIESVVGRTLADTEPLDLEALRRTLDQTDRTLIAYFIDDVRSAAFVVRADTVVAVQLAVSPLSVRSMVSEIGAPWRQGSAEPAFSLAALHRLYQALVEPVELWIATEAVTIVPDLEAASVPFAMLTSGPAESYADAPYLVRDRAIATELAAALLLDTTSAGSAGIAAFGKSTFAADRFTWNDWPLEPLPHVIEEAKRIGRFKPSEIYLEADATEQQFARAASTRGVVHVASHAEANPSLPLYSRIALSPDGVDDGTLHLYEIIERPITTDLVVLSACETAGGGRRGGEGIVGLQYGMRAAGARATLATLWPVADAAMSELVVAFYDGLADGLAKDEALRRAQLEYLDGHDGIEASPFFWAAPVLSGSPAPLPLEAPSSLPALALGVLAVVGVVWWARSRLLHA